MNPNQGKTKLVTKKLNQMSACLHRGKQSNLGNINFVYLL